MYSNNYIKNIKKFWPNVSNIEWTNWQWQLENSIKNPEELSRFLPHLNINDIEKVIQKFLFSITPYFLSLVDHNNKNDPILKQVLPDKKELIDNKHLKLDPFNEQFSTKIPNVFKRYPDRIVFAVTNKCASYCRFCTRKWIWEKDINVNQDNIKNLINYLNNNKNIREVIISGGEPFLISEKLLETIINNILSIPSVEVIRIGTRILSFLPHRITNKIGNMLSKYKPIWIMTHFNHINEITEEVENAVDILIKSGVVLCNQSVLLKGINDEYYEMKKLLNCLQKIRIKPYYIFGCDLVKGTMHFRANINKGIEIMKKLRGNTGGVCIPSFIIDIPKGGKVPILPEYIINENEKNYFFQNYQDKIFKYPKI